MLCHIHDVEICYAAGKEARFFWSYKAQTGTGGLLLYKVTLDSCSFKECWKGQAAYDMQRVAAAAVSESGINNVTPSHSVDLHYTFSGRSGLFYKGAIHGISCPCGTIIFPGTAWMSGLGNSGKRPDHVEESLHRAASSALDVPHLQWCR